MKSYDDYVINTSEIVVIVGISYMMLINILYDYFLFEL